MKRMACALALAAGTGVAGFAALPALSDPNPATIASGLQVNIVPPGTVSGDAPIPLDVRFHGGNVRLIELFIDGARLTRYPLSTRDGRGVIHFTVDPSLLSEGSHEVLIKAYEADGTCATTTTQIVVASADLNALARFESPRRNAEVQGLVPIRIKIDSSIMDPYVTFTVDNDFLAFRNYAPYDYNWDSSKAENGAHTIGIEVMDGRTLQVVQKMTLQVTVKNMGGFTKVQPPPPSKNVRNSGGVAEVIQGVAESAAPQFSLTTKDAVPAMLKNRIPAPVHNLKRSAPSGRSTKFGIANNSPLHGSSASHSTVPVFINPTGVSPLDPLTPVTAANSKGGTPPSTAIAAPNVTPPTANPAGPHVAPGLFALAADPRDLMPAPPKPTFGLARQSTHFRRMSGIALRPGVERTPAHAHSALPGAPALAFRSRPLKIALHSDMERAVTPAKPTPRALPDFQKPKFKTFDVAFNNTLINFDVPPRVEHGLPLAPFRAIFEHAGGTVKWFNTAKVVRAFDNDREIEIHIGDKAAKVNNQPLTMEAVPYIDHGRTIVPLSFIRDAMGLKVTFDQESGHLMIEKN